MSALRSNLYRLLTIRAIVFLCLLLALTLNLIYFNLALPFKPISLIMGLFLVVNLVLFLRLRTDKTLSESEFLFHLLTDVIGVSLLMYFTGGASNPFISYLLVPVIIAAITLSTKQAWGVTLCALAAYSSLLFFNIPLPALMPVPHAMDANAPVFSLHVLGMWANFLVSAGLITWFVLRMSAEIRKQQKQISSLRESTMRNEQIVAIATQAAGTAHELGTPLSTMAVILNDMQINEKDTDKLKDLSTMTQQVELCRSSLKELVTQADPQQKQIRKSVREVLDALLDRWQLLRNEVQTQCERDAREAAYSLTCGDEIQLVLISLLNNSADAANDEVKLVSKIINGRWQLCISDKGPGLTPEVRASLGLDLVSTKENGLGMGFLLSHATLERLGGSITIEEADDIGTHTYVELPAEKIK